MRLQKNLAWVLVAFSASVASASDVDEKTETETLLNQLPLNDGRWQVLSSEDNLSDSMQIDAKGEVREEQTRYEIDFRCKKSGMNIFLSSFYPENDSPKPIDWEYTADNVLKTIKMRIDHGDIFEALLVSKGYRNSGSILPNHASDHVSFKQFLASERIVIADVYPDEQIVVSTSFPTQFRRLCTLIKRPD